MFYKPRSTISIKDNDEKIALLGKITEISEDDFELEDDVGKVRIKSEFKVPKGEIVRVFCKKEGDEIIAEIIQNMNNLNLELYRKVDPIFRNL